MPLQQLAIEHKVAKLLLAAAGLLIASLVLNFWFDRAASTTEQARADSAARIGLLAEYYADLVDAETGQRGYVISGRGAYLAPYDAARRKLADTARRVRAAYDGDRAAEPHLARLADLEVLKLREMQAVIDARQARGAEAARNMVLDDTGLHYMDEMRRLIQGLRSREEETFHGLSEQNRSLRLRLLISQGSVLALALACGFGLYRSLRRQGARREALAEQLRREAREDHVTELPNRRQFYDELERAIDRARRTGDQRAVFFIDLDGFKAVNDALGHDTGDELLREVARQLIDTVRKGDFVARIGGDEFAVVTDAPDCDTVRALARRMIAALEAPLLPAHPEHRISASIGVSVYPLDAPAAEELVAKADTAMYSAKREGKGQVRWIGELQA